MHPETGTNAPPKRHRCARFAIAAAALGGLSTFIAAAPAGASGTGTLKLVNHSGIGKILVNGSGMTVYIFTADGSNKASCTGGCAAVWPPVTVAKGTKPKAGPGVSHLGTIPFGSKLQVTWNKHPLYLYALDNAAGVVSGNGVKEGSGTWFAATTTKVGAKTAAASTTGGSGGSSGGYGY